MPHFPHKETTNNSTPITLLTSAFNVFGIYANCLISYIRKKNANANLKYFFFIYYAMASISPWQPVQLQGQCNCNSSNLTASAIATIPQLWDSILMILIVVQAINSFSLFYSFWERETLKNQQQHSLFSFIVNV